MSFGPAGTWIGYVNEDGSFSHLARVTALSGSGEEVYAREGPCITSADVTAITCKVYNLGTDRNNQSGTLVSPDPTLSAVNVFDTLRTSGWPVPNDPAGYNFRHDVSHTVPATGGNWYLFEYKFTLVDGTVIQHRVKVRAMALQGS